MVFNSLEFALFFPIFFLLYLGVYRGRRLRDLLLLIGSYVFYMSWYWQYAGLIALSTIVDYCVGRRMHGETDQRKRRLLLLASLTTNLGLLGIFKYFNFFADLSRQSLAFLGLELDPFYHQLLLPVGISFYTFQTLSYTIDIYRGQLDPEKNLVRFAVFVSFFPQLVAGPIVRGKQFLSQLRRDTVITTEAVNAGLVLVFCGLFKKIVVADLLAYLAVDAVFQDPSAYSSWDLLMGLYGYAFQIYCDFSGYSDIAIGLAMIMGFKLPMNFNRPYLAESPSDFWRRWHITLSTWLRDYLYISLGGNRAGRLLVARNLMLTMLLGGLWHGAAMNFIIWGAYHGAILILFRGRASVLPAKWPRALRIFAMFHLTLIGWLLFRVTSMENFTDYAAGLAQLSSGSSLSAAFYAVLAVGITIHLLPKTGIDRIWRWAPPRLAQLARAGAYAGLVFLFVGLSMTKPGFIYFQF